MKATYTITQQDVGISARHPISVWRLREEHKTVAPHDHAYHEICLCVGGSGWHLTGGQREKISRGNLLVSAPGQVHSIEIPKWLELFNLFYPVFLNWRVARAAKPHKMGIGIKRSSLQS